MNALINSAEEKGFNSTNCIVNIVLNDDGTEHINVLIAQIVL